jgi:hypothetical protein
MQGYSFVYSKMIRELFINFEPPDDNLLRLKNTVVQYKHNKLLLTLLSILYCKVTVVWIAPYIPQSSSQISQYTDQSMPLADLCFILWSSR